MAGSGIRYLSLAEVLALYSELMERTGFVVAPLRNEGILESAVMRPQMAAHYGGADILRQAALLAAGISQGQAFLDGNKRTAFGTMDTFLRLNGLRFNGRLKETVDQFAALATRADGLEAATARFEQWLRARVQPL
ncbi:MAG TPA: type II toxin-antitoxin system death-on-curing family toxin [Chloroflexota bacterium]|nr:type II toxin-antitoxin system death-on-curing family toxin [Chloroflexota bacterium]